MDTLDMIFKTIKEQGITQQNLADAIGVKKYKISEWKSGKTQSYMNHLKEIANYLGVTTDYLLGNDQKNKPTTKVVSNKEDLLLKAFRQMSDAEKDMLLRAANVKSAEIEKANNR